MDAFDMELYEAVGRLDDVLAKYGQHVRCIAVTPHLRPPLTLNTPHGATLVFFGPERGSPWQRAMQAKAALELALKEADEYVKKLGEELEAERLQGLDDRQRLDEGG